MILHLFNSSLVSGPETLVLPSLARARGRFMAANLREERLRSTDGVDPLQAMSRELGVPYAPVPVARRWDGGAVRRLRELVLALRPELVHAHAVKASVYLAAALRGARPAPPMEPHTLHGRREAEWRPPPIVSTHHGVRGQPDWRSRLYELLYRRLALRAFDRILCVSTEDLESVSGSGVPASRLRLHLNGVDGLPLDPVGRRVERSSARAAWLPREPGRDALFLLGAVGRLSPEKGHGRLLRVLARLQERRFPVDWRCLVFGSGRLDRGLREAARRLGLERRVLWLGRREGVGRELAGLDLLVSLSRAEGLPVSLLEAGWAATPVMSTLVGGVKDLLPDERFGVRVPPAEGEAESARRLAGLLGEAGGEELAGRGRRLQERVRGLFSGRRWLARLWELYAELGVATG